MKTCLTRWAARAAIFILCCSVSLQAVPPQVAAEAAVSAESLDFTRLTTPEALQLAYLILKPGNRNYDGHRAGAMTHISAAAKHFGLDLVERSGGTEDQEKSDTRLRLAHRILESLRPRLAGEEQQPALERVEKAMKRLELGLEFRELKKKAAEAE